MNLWQTMVERLVEILKHLGAAALAGMMIITCADVMLRKMGSPIFGAVEMVSLLATIVLASAMPYTHMEKGHVGVDLVMRRISPHKQNLVDAITALVSGILFGLVAWQMYLFAKTQENTGEVSMSLELPTYLFIHMVAIAFGVLTLVIFTDFLQKARKVLNP